MSRDEIIDTLLSKIAKVASEGYEFEFTDEEKNELVLSKVKEFLIRAAQENIDNYNIVVHSSSREIYLTTSSYFHQLHVLPYIYRYIKPGDRYKIIIDGGYDGYILFVGPPEKEIDDSKIYPGWNLTYIYTK